MEILNIDNFKQKIAEDKLTLVDFSASWCMPCKMLKPIVEELAEKMTDINVCNVDIDDSVELAREYKIFSVPSLLLFKKGQKIDSIVGLMNYEELVDFVNRNK